MADRISHLIDSLRAAAEPTRLRLLAICCEGELTVSEITSIVGQSQPRVSRHLKLLCKAGLLMRFREGHFVLYRVPANGEGAAMVQQLLSQLPRDDEQLELDAARMEIIKRDRARRAADYLRGNPDSNELQVSGNGNSEIDEVIVNLLGADRVGELLDIGTGTGCMLKLLGQYADSAVGIDICADMLAVARSNLHAAGLGKVMVRRGDMYGLPYPDCSFDTVTVDHVLCEANDPARALLEAARVLRSKGRLLVIEYSKLNDGDPSTPGISDLELESWFDSSGLHCVHHQRFKHDTQNIVVALAQPSRGRGIVAA